MAWTCELAFLGPGNQIFLRGVILFYGLSSSRFFLRKGWMQCMRTSGKGSFLVLTCALTHQTCNFEFAAAPFFILLLLNAFKMYVHCFTSHAKASIKSICQPICMALVQLHNHPSWILQIENKPTRGRPLCTTTTTSALRNPIKAKLIWRRSTPFLGIIRTDERSSPPDTLVKPKQVRNDAMLQAR